MYHHRNICAQVHTSNSETSNTELGLSYPGFRVQANILQNPGRWGSLQFLYSITTQKLRFFVTECIKHTFSTVVF
jgi:hypothetical protein